MVSWSYDTGACPAIVQRDAGHANVRTTQAYLHVVDRAVGDRLPAAASARNPALDQLSAMVLSNSGRTAAAKVALLREPASQAASAAVGTAAPAPLRVVDEQSG